MWAFAKSFGTDILHLDLVFAMQISEDLIAQDAGLAGKVPTALKEAFLIFEKTSLIYQMKSVINFLTFSTNQKTPFTLITSSHVNITGDH